MDGQIPQKCSTSSNWYYTTFQAKNRLKEQYPQTAHANVKCYEIIMSEIIFITQTHTRQGRDTDRNEYRGTIEWPGRGQATGYRLPPDQYSLT